MQEGRPISTYDIPKMFWDWLGGISQNTPVIYIEAYHGNIVLVRTKTPVTDVKAIGGIDHGRLVKDASGCYLERKYRPRIIEGKIAVV